MNSLPGKIIIVDDEPVHMEAIERAINEALPGCEIGKAGSLAEYRRLLERFTPDIALIDLNLPDGKAIEALESPIEDARFPVLIMTSFGSEKWAVEAIKTGALDYMVKSHETFLDMPRTLERSMREWSLIQDRKQAREALRQSEEVFRQIAVNSRDVYWLMVPGSRALIYVNPAYEQVYNRSIESLKEHPLSWLEVVHPADVARVRESFTTGSGEGLNLEFRVLQPEEGVRWLWARTFPITDDTGAVRRILGVASDITDRKEIEEQQLVIQKLESIGVLAGGIAHDFNNLLTMIVGNICLAMMNMDQSDSAYERLKKAEGACETAKDLAYRLLTFSKGGDPVTKVVSPGGVLREAVDFFLAGSPIQGEYRIDEDLFPVEMDENQMRQVFYNLTINAKEAMPSGGTLRVAAKNKRLKGARKTDLKPGDYVNISFIDEGIGIRAADLNKIFDPYFTSTGLSTKKGKGLGLAICHSIVQKHGGSIHAESVEGEGATFEIYLPAYKEPEE
ncbi:MAG: response regulator [Spirochaetes bacterium]|nr:MAG: response regulator [Spirochaetota bacterium]